MKSRIIAMFIVMLWIPMSSAKTVRSKLKDLNVAVEIPKGWKSAEKLFGMPFVLLGPEQKPKRPVIGIVNTTIDQNLSMNTVKKELDLYQDGRKKWVEKNKGKVIRFAPYQMRLTKNSYQMHVLGLEYEMGGQKFVELSQYLTCSNRLIHIKSLYTTEQFKKLKKTNKQIIESLKCTATKK